jgi:MFS family permease
VDRPEWIRRAEAWLDGNGRMWLRRTIIAIVAIVALIGLALLAAAFLPRWWSHRVAHQVNGGMTVGIMLGLFYGFVFTVLPLATLLRTFRKRRPWKVWGSLAVLAIVLAGPNLLTLGIVIGSGHAAHAGERTLDVDAPGFRGATLAGAIVAAFAVAAVKYLLASRRWTQRKLDTARRPS